LYYYKKRVLPLAGKAADPEAAEKLWRWSAREVGLERD
jgi:hypothetical protein